MRDVYAGSSDYNIEIPQHVQSELSHLGKKVIVVENKHPLLNAIDTIWSYSGSTIIGFSVICFAVGFTVVTRTIIRKYMPK